MRYFTAIFAFRLWLPVTLLSPILLVGCSREPLTDDTLHDRTISFDVNLAASGEGNATRSASLSTGVMTLEGDTDKPLYLVASVSDSIPVLRRNTLTRGVTVDSSTLSSFGVYAARSDADQDALPAYMRNVEVTAASGWAPEDEYLWPGDCSLRFTAYSPFVSSGSDEGITALPSEASPFVLTYHTPTEVSAQEDLLYATPVEASASPCVLTFNHALTAIRFVAGSELAPCMISSISIGGVMSDGILNITDGVWTALSGVASYSVTPGVTLPAAEGSEYVTPGNPITSDEDTFLLIPQTLGSDAEVTVTLSDGDKETLLTASLSDQIWEGGKTVTYRISANPVSDSLTLDVAGDLTTPYTGGNATYTVSSYYLKGGEKTPVEWKAECVDADGNVVESPVWLKSMTLSGSGVTEGTVSTQMNDLVFLAKSTSTANLQNAADINSSSGNTPYNLASATGAAGVENTANTYIIGAPGQYSLPLVYGNAVKDGTANSGAYTSSSRNRYALKNFVNHKGNAITDPYIYNNSGCVPADAVLVWEDELNLVRNVALSADGKSLTFDIPHNTIRQGNAIVAIRDAAGEILWSWQLWVTDFIPSLHVVKMQSDKEEFDVWTRNLGYISPGDQVEFPEASVTIRFTQVNVPDGLEPLQKTLVLTQEGAVITTPECNTFYQWGRKDPMMSSVKQWYDADHQEIKVLPTVNMGDVMSASADMMKWWILNPAAMLTAQHDQTYAYTNLWNTSLSATDNEKSVYDPSPAGYKINLGNDFRYLASNSTVTATSDYFLVTPANGIGEIEFRPVGYRSGTTGEIQGVGSRVEIWYSTCMTTRHSAGCLVVTSTMVESTTNSLYHAFSLRPMAE